MPQWPPKSPYRTSQAADDSNSQLCGCRLKTHLGVFFLCQSRTPHKKKPHFKAQSQPAGFGPCFPLPRFGFGYLFLTHGHFAIAMIARSRLAPASAFSRCFSAGGSYDYIIVGAGSAGATIAHRLVKDAGANVLLIENGRSHVGSWDWWKINMPAALTYNLADAKYNWDFYTVPQKHMDGRRLHQPRGRALGGSSSLNAMAYVRGHALDYERWAQEIGPGGEAWSYRHVLPYYKKAQRHSEGESTYRGGSGPLAVTRQRSPAVRAINDAFVAAGEEAGYPRTEDMNGFQQEGFGAMDMTVTPEGVRASTWECYLKPLLHPKTPEDEEASKRFQVLTGQMAVRLLFENDKAVGVETIPSPKPKKGGGFHRESSGTTEKHFAKAEVILCAGAVGSPQLLMLSGIGPAKELERLGVPVRLDQTLVGENLQDHLEFYVQYLSDKNCSLYPYAATFPGLGLLSRYLEKFDGPPV
ncbi:unnamed protein product, partial [Effrenium voratum]